MTLSWPDTLPAVPLRDGLEGTLPKTTLRTEMDAGPAKVRRRFTAGVEPITLTLRMTTAQLNVFRTFYSTTTGGGALAFAYTHPQTGAVVSVRFVGEPKWRPWVPGKWLVALQIEVLP